MKKEVLVVGHGDMGKTCVSQLQEKCVAAVLIEPSADYMGKVIAHNCDMAPIVVNPNIIHVNGINYEPIPNHRDKGYSKMLGMAMEMIAMPGFGSGYERQLPAGINIPVEFKLIQQKKSRLSKWERSKVEKLFHENFRPVKP